MLVFCGIGTAVAYAADDLSVQSVISIETTAYTQTMIEKINSAQESIFISMPAMDFIPAERDNKATVLLQALVKAHRRGVFVFVLLHLRNHQDETPQNLAAFFFLNDNGIAVHYDNVTGDFEANFIVIDKRETIESSIRWTEESLSQPYQVTTAIISEVYAQHMVDFVTSVPVFDNPLALDYYNQLYLPTVLVQSPNGMKAFLARNDMDAFLCYLYLLREYQRQEQPEWMTVNADDLAAFLRLGKKNSREEAREKVRVLLERLFTTYVLIGFKQISEQADYKVALYDPASGEQLKLPFLSGIRLADAFFDTGWVYRLSLAEYYVYLFLLSQEAQVGYASWFPVRYDDVKLLPGIRDDQYAGAIRSLRSFGLITVHYKENPTLLSEEYGDFECRIRTPYLDDWMKEQKEALVKRYSARLVNQSLTIAKEFLLENDLTAIERIVRLLQVYPPLTVNQAVITFIKPMSPENPYKTIDYLEEKLREQAAEKQTTPKKAAKK